MSQLTTLLRNQVTESSDYESFYAQQRERNHRYYSLQPMGNEREGYSQYIDPSVFESVEDKKAVYHQTFLSSRQPVRFSGPDHMQSAAMTAYVQKVLRQNKIEDLLPAGWHDAFVGKKMVVWLDWKRNRETVTLQFNGTPTAQANEAIGQLGEIVDVDSTQLESVPIQSLMGQVQYVHNGSVKVQIDKSYVCVELVQPEYAFRDNTQTYARDAGWNSRRMDMSRMALVEWGFDPAMIKNAHLEDATGKSITEQSARTGAPSTTVQARAREPRQANATIYQTRATLAPEDLPDDLAKYLQATDIAMYDIYWTGNDILMWADGTPAIRKIEEMDVYEWSEYKIAHSATGLCTADLECHQQKASSSIKRGVMDNMNLTNNPRWEANTDALRNPEDLYDNPIGGVLETDGVAPGNVLPLAQPQLSPMVFGVLQMLDRDSEARRGMSDLASGMNQGALTNQNADSLIERLSNAGMRRVAMGARDFAATMYGEIMRGIVRLARQHDKSQDQKEAGGQMLVIAPAQWKDDPDLEIDEALTPDEARELAMQLMAMDGRIKSDEELQLLYSMEEKHRLWDTVYELLGVKDATRFLAPPGSPQVKQRMQLRQQQQTAQQQAQQKAAQFQEQVLQDQLDLGWQALNNKIMDTLHDNELDDKKHLTDTYFQRQELALDRMKLLGNPM